MREAFGGAFMIRLVLVFIVVYTCFMAIAVNYAKTFRIKNRVINILEQTQYKYNDDNSDAVIESISSYLDSVSYNIVDENHRNSCENVNHGRWVNNGVCIVPMCPEESDSCYYKVTTYIVVEAPFILNKMTVSVHGETKTIEY